MKQTELNAFCFSQNHGNDEEITSRTKSKLAMTTAVANHANFFKNKVDQALSNDISHLCLKIIIITMLNLKLCFTVCTDLKER